MKQNSIMINGRAYSAVTGLPLKVSEASPATPSSAANAAAPRPSRGVPITQLHVPNTQTSAILKRRYVSQPAKAPLASRAKRVKVAVARTDAISKFSPAAAPAPTPRPTAPDRPAEPHPVVVRATRRQPLADKRPSRPSLAAQPKPPRSAPNAALEVSRSPHAPRSAAPKPAAVLKQEAITEALSRTIDTPKRPHRAKRQPKRRSWLNLAPAGLAVMLLGGYFTYLSMPNISVRVAAIQSGIDASYPGYRPSGYSLRGPIRVHTGEVSMRFAYAGGDQHFTITQQKTDWDTAAVKQFVDQKTSHAGVSLVNGLTIYTYDGNAAWTDGGILYQITGNAPLSSDQLQRIAASL